MSFNVEDGLYDLHNHLLFGVDDGAGNSAETEAMLRDAVNNKIKVIVDKNKSLGNVYLN